MPDKPPRRSPTPEQLEAARNKRVRDVVAPGLDVLFCGINPGLWSGAVGHHFAHPGNRFWKVLYRAGFTPELLQPRQERLLLEFGVGITNLVARTTSAASELSAQELRAGARALARKVARLRPSVIAFTGVTAYRTALSKPGAQLGQQENTIAGVPVWVLPNPSGLQAHYQMEDMVKSFAAVRASLPDHGEARA